jgi:hypothetical protein
MNRESSVKRETVYDAAAAIFDLDGALESASAIVAVIGRISPLAIERPLIWR